MNPEVQVPDFALASNLFTGEWLRHVSVDSSFVVSGCGAWALLAALSAGASGDALQELEDAVGLDSAESPAQLNQLIALLRNGEGVSAGLGIWTTPEAELRSDYVDQFPLLKVDVLPADPAVLDAWVQAETNGILSSFPGTITPETLLVAASVLVADASWLQPFTSGSAPWPGRDGRFDSLERVDTDLTLAAVLQSSETKIGRVICQTDGAFDVHLLTGDPNVLSHHVLSVGIEALVGGAVAVAGGESLKTGTTAGCLSVTEEPTESPELRISLPPFEIGCTWDLAEDAAVFGLATALDRSNSHFDRLCSFPLAIDSCKQNVSASFSERGFRAAAVTAAMLWMGSAAAPATTNKVISVELNRPFGFLVVHRDTSLVLFAGWLTEPTEPPVS